MQGHSDHIVRWEPTGAEKAREVQEAWIKKLNVMKCCKGKTSSMPPPTPITAHTHTPTHTHTRVHRDFKTPGLAHTLPVAHYLNLPFQLPLTLSSCLPPSTYYSLTAYLPLLSSRSPALHLFFPLVSFSLAPPRSALCWCHGRQRGE